MNERSPCSTTSLPLAASTLVPIPDGVDNDAALLLGDVFSTGWFCAEQAALQPGSICAVVGCGPVGLCAVMAAANRDPDAFLDPDVLDPDRVGPPHLSLAMGTHFCTGAGLACSSPSPEGDSLSQAANAGPCRRRKFPAPSTGLT